MSEPSKLPVQAEVIYSGGVGNLEAVLRFTNLLAEDFRGTGYSNGDLTGRRTTEESTITYFFSGVGNAVAFKKSVLYWKERGSNGSEHVQRVDLTKLAEHEAKSVELTDAERELLSSNGLPLPASAEAYF